MVAPSYWLYLTKVKKDQLYCPWNGLRGKYWFFILSGFNRATNFRCWRLLAGNRTAAEMTIPRGFKNLGRCDDVCDIRSVIIETPSLYDAHDIQYTLTFLVCSCSYCFPWFLRCVFRWSSQCQIMSVVSWANVQGQHSHLVLLQWFLSNLNEPDLSLWISFD